MGQRVDPPARFGNTAIGAQREAMIMIVPSHPPSLVAALRAAAATLPSEKRVA